MSDQPQAIFNIDKVYVKDLSVEVPGAPGIFLMNESPQLEVQLNQSVQRVGEALYELTLQATITAKSGDSCGSFEVHYRGECDNAACNALSRLVGSVAASCISMPDRT